MRKIALACAALLACTAGTRTEVKEESAVDHGRELFTSTTVSASGSNRFTCATCHPGIGPADRIYSGASLAGATTRTSFWGGARIDLLTSINDCRLSFMDAVIPWTKDDDDATAMYAYLASVPGPSTPVPFTVVQNAPDLPAGDPVRGKAAFELACVPCHGAVHTGAGRIATFIPTLPDEFNGQHATFAVAARRLIVIQKIRQGGFTQVGGNMAPFSMETLADADVAGIVTFLDLY